MSTLYINTDGINIGITGGYFVIRKDEEILKKIPKESVTAITLYANVAISTHCIRYCLKNGINLNYGSKNGAYFGKLTSTKHINVNRLKKQVYNFDNKKFCLNLSKKIIEAKICNQIVVLKRYGNNDKKLLKNTKKMQNILKKIKRCSFAEEIMGYEGLCARYYFSTLSEIIRPEFKFEKRSKNPPKDEFNAMLSLGYTILMYEIYAEIENRGISPYIAFLHTSNDRYPALVSDMMEEWRAVIVDSVVLNLVQGNGIKKTDFEYNNNGVYLKKEAMKKFIEKMELKFNTKNKYLSENDETYTFRYCIYLQTLNLVKAIENGDTNMYEPIKIR